MTKLELMNLLQKLPDNAEIYLASPTGNFWHDTLARPLFAVDVVDVVKSDYHNGRLKIVEERQDDSKRVWVLFTEDTY